MCRHGDVRSLAAQHRGRGCWVLHAAHAVGPRAGGIHDARRVHVNHAAAQPVGDAYSVRPPIGESQAGHLGVIHDRRAGHGGVEQRGERQPRVVGGGVEVARAAAQANALKHWLGVGNPGGVEAAVRRDVLEEREQVVQQQAGAELPERHARAGVHWPRERQRPHEVGRDAEQHPAFVARLEDEPQVAVLKVAHAPVHQARRPAGGAAPEVIAFDHGDIEPTACGIARDARARDAPANDQDVESSLAEAEDLRGARGSG